MGFDWEDARGALGKVEEETRELEVALGEGGESVEAEIGDLLFALANLARHLDVDPETALRSTNAKFEKRFRRIEQAVDEQGKCIDNATLDEMEALWQEAKEQS